MSSFIRIEDTDIMLIDGDRGSNYPSKNEFYDKEYCLFLDAKNVTENGFDFSETHFITKEKDDILRNGKLQRNDIVMMTRGSVGNVALYDKTIPYDNIRINSGMIIIRCNKKFKSLQVYYLLKSKFVQKQISDMMSGSVQKQLPVTVINKIQLPGNSIRVDIIYAIDRKIENNNKINKELESMAKTIYDYWFLQFEFPNEDGKPYKSSGGKMVWNEELKREIPEGWEAGFFSNLIEIGNGKDHKDLRDGKIPVYGSGGMMRTVDTYIYKGESVLIPRKGTLNNILYVNGAFWTVDTMFYSKMKKKHSALYTYYSAKLFDFEKLNTGTGVPSMTSSIIYNLKIVIPPDKILERFDNYVQTFYKQIHEKERENRELVLLRDFLLPLLMNGQVGFKS